jgi:hypothetical protein
MAKNPGANINAEILLAMANPIGILASKWAKKSLDDGWGLLL